MNVDASYLARLHDELAATKRERSLLFIVVGVILFAWAVT